MCLPIEDITGVTGVRDALTVKPHIWKFDLKSAPRPSGGEQARLNEGALVFI